jgi:hypothetical protein
MESLYCLCQLTVMYFLYSPEYSLLIICQIPYMEYLERGTTLLFGFEVLRMEPVFRLAKHTFCH